MSAEPLPHLSELRLTGFKCFRDEVALPFRALNLLSGINSKGKSTVLQALLLLHQAVANASKMLPFLLDNRAIHLNGRFVRLGTYREVLHRALPLSAGIDISFEVSQGNRSLLTSLRLKAEEDTARDVTVAPISREGFVDNAPSDVPITKLLTDFPGEKIFLPLQYVSADRLGPQEFFRWADEGVGTTLFVGARGEHTAEVLQLAGTNRDVDAKRRRAEADTPTLLDQASTWLRYVFDGGALEKPLANESVLGLQMNSDGSAHYMRPVHLGFGFSYVLPILVAGLVAMPGSQLLVENPEAHLHPLAQSRLGEFLAQVAQSGVQVFVESHSEHILNAFRFAVRSQVLSAESLSVLYFRGAEVDPVLRIPVDERGGIASWPEGFFDQRLHDFQRLFGV